jgi:drug/metabolite transporter (DMT)-like permease
MVVSNAGAQISLKKASAYSHTDKAFYLCILLAGSLYFGSFVLYTISMKHFSLTRLSPVTTLGSMILVVLGGIFLYKEMITMKFIVGLGLGIVSILLIASCDVRGIR